MHAVALNAADPAHTAVAMKTEVGRLTGVWRGSAPILPGGQVDVELELPRARTSEEIILDPPATLDPGMLRCIVTNVFEDGILAIKVGSAALQVELEDTKELREGATVVIIADDLEFYPTGT